MSGYTVLFTTTAKMLGELGSAKMGSLFERRLAKYIRRPLQENRGLTLPSTAFSNQQNSRALWLK